MASRSHESPMDFEYTAPQQSNSDSPFVLATNRLQANNYAQSPTPAPRNKSSDKMDLDSEDDKKKRPHSIFASPSKSTSTPFQSSLFSTPSKSTAAAAAPLPAPSFYRTPSAFTTPKPAKSFGFGPTSDSFMSSPAEAYASSPDLGADTEETPEVVRRVNVKRGMTPGRSGRGEIVRRKMSELGPPKKVRKRRAAREGGVSWARGLDEDEEDEEETSGDSGSGSSPRKKVTKKAKEAVLTWADTHRDVPMVLSHYLQLGFNIFIVFLVMGILIYFVRAVYNDVNKRIEQYSADMVAEMSVCQQDFLENGCATKRTRFNQAQCEEWEKCMYQDVSHISRSRVSAETLAVILNSFIEPISYKSMLFISILLFGSLFISNTAFGYYRSKLAADAAMHPAATMPATPMHSQAAQFMGQTPMHLGTPMQGFEHPAAWATTPRRPVGGYGRVATPATGRRRRELEWSKM